MPPFDYDQAAAVTAELETRLAEKLSVNRRTVLGGLGLLGSGLLTGTRFAHTDDEPHPPRHENFGPAGEYQNNGVDPHEYLTAFNTGQNGQDTVDQAVYEENGRTVREFEFVAVDTTLAVANNRGILSRRWRRSDPPGYLGTRPARSR